LQGASAKGDVLLVEKGELVGSDPPHASFAGSRAWLALGEKLLDAGDAEGAITSARNGLEELGKDYAGPRVKDDTGLKLGLARDYINDGQMEDGARLLLGILRNRLAMYARLHREEIME
jgi:hypothetical protein